MATFLKHSIKLAAPSQHEKTALFAVVSAAHHIPRIRSLCCERCSTSERGLSPPPSNEGCVVGVVQRSSGSQRSGMHECSSLTHTSHASNAVLFDGFILQPAYSIVFLRRVSAPSPLYLVDHRGARSLLVPCRILN